MLMAIGPTTPDGEHAPLDHAASGFPGRRQGRIVWFRLPLLLLVAVTGYGVIGYRFVPARPTPSSAADRRRLLRYT